MKRAAQTLKALSLIILSLVFMKADASDMHLPGQKAFSALRNGQDWGGQPQPPLSGTIERLLNYIEDHIVKLAEAMPEDKFNFSPENLNIEGSDFKGVRTFAGQIKHLATDNFAIWSPLTREPMPDGIEGVDGPPNLKTKADIIKFLKSSFELGHRAIATLTTKNATDQIPFRGGTLARLDLAFYALTHANEHYGQMVVYIRMCGIIPPASVNQH